MCCDRDIVGGSQRGAGSSGTVVCCDHDIVGGSQRETGSREVEASTGKDAEKPWTGVQTGAGIGNYRETKKWDFAVDIAINER